MSRNPYSSFPNKEAFNFLERGIEANYNFSAAQAVFDAPKSISAFDITHFKSKEDRRQIYGDSRGRDFVLEKSVEFFRRHGINCTIQNVSLNDGVLSSIAKTYDILMRVGESILVATPTFGYYFQQLRDKGIAFETVPTKKEDGFLIDPIILERAIIRNEARILLLCYPNNPTGAVMTKENAEAIAAVVKKYNVFVIQDGIFFENNLTETKSRNYPIAAVDGMLERSFTLYGFSKSMGILGGTTAIGVGNKDFIRKFAKLGGYPKIDEKMIAATLEDSEENREYLEASRLEYLSRIDLIKEKLAQLNKKFFDVFGGDESTDEPFVKPYIANPESGSVYILDFSQLRKKIYQEKELNTGLDVAKWLLDEASVAVVPGECFLFEPEEMLVRISLHNPVEEIDKAFEAIVEAIDKIHNPPSHYLSKASAVEALKGIKSRL